MTDLNDGITEIADSAGKQQTPTTGAAADKTHVRHDLEEKILLIANQLSALDKLADDDLEETGLRIAALANTNLAALADYRIVAADATELTNLTIQFHSVKTAPRAPVVDRSSQTVTLPDKIGKVTSILRNRLDKLMTKFKRSDPEFYAGYQTARVIVDRGGSSKPTPPAPQPAPPH